MSEPGSDELWLAPPPLLPPADGLGGVLAVDHPRERTSRWAGWACLALVGAAIVLLLVDALAWLVPLGVLAAPVVGLFLVARRTVVAVGDGWWLVRSVGRTRWSTADELTSVRLRGSRLELRSPIAHAGIGLGASRDVARALARLVLSSGADVDEPARSVLSSWLEAASPGETARRSRSSRHAVPRRRRRTGGWQLALSGVCLVVVAPYALQHGWHDLRIHRDPDAVRVVAVVDRVVEQCGRGGCRWWSYGHYVIEGQAQEEVAVATERRSPARGPQTVLVDPEDPREVVNVDESPAPVIAIGVAALTIGTLFLALWARPLLRRNAVP